ncbi:MAG: flavodoxin domain-containing protein [Anaerolineae bacterium]
MASTVLVAYATRYGSTREVAEAVADTLRGQGLGVDVQPAHQVRSVESYGAVVLGAPLYIGNLLKDAQRFLERHQQALAQRPVAVFAMGPTGNVPTPAAWQEVRVSLDRALAKHPWLKPVALELFGGKYDPATLRFPDSLLAKMPATPLKGMPASDLRDWARIRAWAGELAAVLQAAVPTRAGVP